MRPVYEEHSYRHLHMQFTCPCGRELRVKRELAGTEVRCWDCRQMVRVPVPRSAHPILGAVWAGLREALATRWLVAIAATAVLATGALLVPRAGAGLEVVAMMGVAAGYALVIARAAGDPHVAGDEDEPEKERPQPRRVAVQAIAVVTSGLALSVPWLLRLLDPRSDSSPIRITAAGALAFAAAALILPPAMLLAFGRGTHGPLTPRGLRAIVRHHPFVMIMALALAPLGLAAAEMAAFVLGGVSGWLPFLLLELHPGAASLANALGIRIENPGDLGGWPRPRYLYVYGRWLAHGYTLIGAIPPSLLRPRMLSFYPWQWVVNIQTYHYCRAILTLLIAPVPLLFLSLQARLLGTLSKHERTRPVP